MPDKQLVYAVFLVDKGEGEFEFSAVEPPYRSDEADEMGKRLAQMIFQRLTPVLIDFHLSERAPLFNAYLMKGKERRIAIDGPYTSYIEKIPELYNTASQLVHYLEKVWIEGA